MKNNKNNPSAPANVAHTPGPWNVEHPYGEPGVFIAGPNTGLIAKLYQPDATLFNVDKPVSIEANARLIAAAPELLAALRDLSEGLVDIPPERMQIEMTRRMVNAKAAIAKATV